MAKRISTTSRAPRAIRNPEVDAYIENSEKFAKPILNHLRKTIHAHCPQVDERMRWGLPHFDYGGETMCVMASYTQHCSFTFMKEAIMSDPRLRKNPSLKANKRYMGDLRSLADLPGDAELAKLIKEAMKLNDTGVKLPKRAPKTPAAIAMPDDFKKRLAAHKTANRIFESKSPSFRKEYLVWITQAKTPATREKRIDESLVWIAEEKSRFWKYQK